MQLNCEQLETGNVYLYPRKKHKVLKFKLSLYKQFKQSFITEISQFKSDFLCQKSTHNDENTTEKLLNQMEKEITFLHEELKSKNTIITVLLENNSFIRERS